MPKISVIIPIYNVEKYLNRCIDSITNQTLQDIEIILATDGPESCNAICEEYAQKDSRVKILYNPGSYGKAFNKALDVAQGDYIGIVEADDWCDKTMFEKMYRKAVAYDADVVKCGFYFAYDKSRKNYRPLHLSAYPEDFSVYNYPALLGSQPSVWSCIYRKDFLIKNNIKMMEERQSFIDTPFHHETLYMADKYILLDEPLYYYYQDNTNQSVQNIKVFDGLNSEKYSYKLIYKDKFRYNELKEGFILSTVTHLRWNYERLQTDEQKKAFWLEAHNYLNSIDLTGIQFSFFDNDLKDFYTYLKNSRQKPEKCYLDNYNEYVVKLLNFMPVLKIFTNHNKIKINLFSVIPILNIKLNGLYKQKYKLFGLFYIVTVKKIK